ncbi:MAG TPA: F0F1 ATP synthase subunit gamma [Xanthobacteraceae bacterium]|jgi:F-type H+-transporting ATPase subunit gamma
MPERLSEIAAQIHNVRQLATVVTAMRGIAASRAQKGRALLAGIDAYTAVVSQAIGEALNVLPTASPAPAPAQSKRALILFCAEQGFAGAFSERVFEAAGGDLESAAILLVGTRGAAVASEQGIQPAWSTAMTTRVEGIAAFANGLAEALYGYVAQGAIAVAEIVFSRSVPGGLQVDRHSLLPIDLGRFARPVEKEPPLIELAPERLVEQLAAEYVYAQLCEAATHAFVAENDARVSTMMAAKNNTEKKLAALLQRERQLRQEEITTEIIEFAAGAEVLQSSRSPR